jgi:hypothetical protein
MSPYEAGRGRQEVVSATSVMAAEEESARTPTHRPDRMRGSQGRDAGVARQRRTRCGATRWGTPP